MTTEYLKDLDYTTYQPGPAGELAICTDPLSTGNNCLTTPDCVDGKIANALDAIELGGVMNVHLVTSSTSITMGAGTTRLFLIIVGGGGGGSGGENAIGGAGGGGGGVSIALVTVTAAEVVVCTVGNGGAAGTSGNSGGTGGTSLIKGISAYGGTGGVVPGGLDDPTAGIGGEGESGNPAVYPTTGLIWSKKGSTGFCATSATSVGAGGSPWGINLDDTTIGWGLVTGGAQAFAYPANVLWAGALMTVGHRGCGGSGGDVDTAGFAGGAGIIIAVELGT